MRTAFLLLLLAAPTLLCAQAEGLPVGARPAGMGNAAVMLTDVWSTHHNQAGLAGLEHTTVGIFFQRHFLSEELNHQGLAAAIKLGKGTIGVSGNLYGFDLYSETKAGLAYAMSFGDGLRAGVQLDYLNIRLGEGYGSRSAVAAEIGVQARLVERLWIGAHVYNPNRAKVGGPYEERIPTIIRAGLGWLPSSKLTINCELVKDIDKQESVRAGLEWHPSKVLFLRTGMSTAPVQGHFGLGVRFGNFDADLAVAFRSQLGATPQIGLLYRFE